MRTRTGILLLLASTAMVVAGCRRDPLTYRDKVSGDLTVRVFIPEAVLTKAETGDEAAVNDERVVSSLQIWVYRNGGTDASSLVGYRMLDGDALAATGLNAGHETRFTIPVDQTFVDTKPRVDVYALVNGESAGFTIDKFAYTNGDWSKLNPSDLQDYVFGADYFGVSTLTSSVPAAGLPMAGISMNQEVTGDFPVLSISTVRLTRVVSKMRFVFCQMTDNGVPVDEFHITGISFSGQIGQTEKLFTALDYDSSGYVTLNKTYPADGPLPVSPAYNPAPGDYLYQPGMTAQQYDDIIRTGVSSGVLTQWGLAYLRESDQKISGSISYTVGTGGSMRSKVANFTMDATGDFARNHSWTIFAYFIGGRLVVQPTVLPWIAGNDRFTFKTEGSTELGYEKPWLRYDIDQQAWTWNDTWLVVAYGYEGGSVGKPTNSPMFTLNTSNSNDLHLQLNNDQFILVQMTSSLDGEGNPIYAYTKLGQSMVIPASSDITTTNFYVVPINDNVMADPYVKVFLTEMHSGDGLPPTNIPFNHNLPGDEDHTSILIYNPGRAEYIANKDIHKNTSSNSQTTQYWLEEEN